MVATCVCFQRRRVRHNANYVPYVQIRFDLYVRESLASLSIAVAFFVIKASGASSGDHLHDIL